MDSTVFWIWFSQLEKVSHQVKSLLLQEFGNVEDIFSCPDFSEFSYISNEENYLLSRKDLRLSEAICEKSKKLGQQIITYESELYPRLLRQISVPPYVLYAKGDTSCWNSYTCIGMVGTRYPGDYGNAVTKRFTEDFVKNGIITVSGMARGIDSAVAQTTIDCGGRTIAVLGCGLDKVYPPENGELMTLVEKSGALVSEFPPGSPPLSWHFPQRNRIISGMSQGVVVIESAPNGGSLITARQARQQGRDVFAVPGSIFRKTSSGPNILIAKGEAEAVTSAQDIISRYAAESRNNSPRTEGVQAKNQKPPVSVIQNCAGLSENEIKILECLTGGELHTDEIKRRTGMEINELNSTMALLELSGHVEKGFGNIYKLNI